MRILAVAGLMVALSGCAALPSGAQGAATAPALVQATPHKPRPSQQELLAAYWAERRATHPVFETFDAGAPATDSGELRRMADDRRVQDDIVRRETAQREEVRAAVQTALRR